MKFKANLAFLFLLFCVFHVQGQPSTEDFARLPYMQSVQLSPDGKHLAFIHNKEQLSIIFTQNLETGKFQPVITNDNKVAHINWFQWANNGRLLVSTRSSAPFKSKTFGYAGAWGGWLKGRVMTKTRLQSVSIDGSNKISMVKPGKSKGKMRWSWTPWYQDVIVSDLPDDEDHILMSLSPDEPGYPHVYKVNVNTASRSRVQVKKHHISTWISDQQGRVRMGICWEDDDNNTQVFLRESDSGKFKLLWEFDAMEEDGGIPLGFDTDANIVYVRAPYQGRSAIYQFDINNRDAGLTLVASDPKYDISGNLIRTRSSRKVVGVYLQGSEGSSIYWDKKAEAFQHAIDKALPEAKNYVLDTDISEQRYVVYSQQENHPGQYLFGDRKAKQLTAIGSQYPELQEEIFSRRQQLEFIARDGLKIEAFLTLPTGKKAENLPAILLPHGGPHSRDYAGFDYWAEFLASRGYAVLQVNFRGSAGYGFEFLKAGFGNWGLAMQEDVNDGANWLIEQGIADADRICIAGGSYGGYAALVGAYKKPDLYQCAISFAGVSDLKDLFTDFSNLGYSHYMRTTLGTGWGQSKRLKENSPVYNTDKIAMPVLVMHGNMDSRVLIRHSESYVENAKADGKDVEFEVFDGGDHHLSRYEHRKQFLESMASFLGKHLKSQPEDSERVALGNSDT